MSQEFMDPELFADFIVEAKEHLETIEPNLLELEKNPGNLSLLNEIFRPMHSLKGASGFLGLNNINGLAHKAENILDELRKGNMRVTAEIMDVILAATDGLRTIIDSLETSGIEGLRHRPDHRPHRGHPRRPVGARTGRSGGSRHFGPGNTLPASPGRSPGRSSGRVGTGRPRGGVRAKPRGSRGRRRRIRGISAQSGFRSHALHLDLHRRGPSQRLHGRSA